MKYTEAIALNESLKNVSGKKFRNPKGTFAVAKNSKLLALEIESLNEMKTETTEFTEFEKRKHAIISKFVQRDDDGNAVLVEGKANSVKLLPDSQESLNKELTDLMEEFKDVIKDREEQLNQYNAMLSEDTDVLGQLKTINISHFPSDTNLSDLLNMHSIIEIDEDGITSTIVSATKEEILLLFGAIMSRSNSTSEEFNKIALYNYNQISKLVNEIVNYEVFTTDYRNYEDSRVELCLKYAELDDNNNPVLDESGQRYIINEDNLETFNKELAELRLVNADVIEEQTKVTENFKKSMHDTVELELMLFTPEHLDENITPEELNGFLPFIED